MEIAATSHASGADPADHVAGCDAPVAPVAHDADWHRSAQWARRLGWVSLAALLIEGGVGLWQGLAVGSVALTGWALGGGSEGLARAMGGGRLTGGAPP